MSLPRMSWHIGDYKKDTGHLRAAGHGAYFLLSMHYWATGSLPDDDKQLAAIACMTDREWKAHRNTMRAFFKGDGVWRHKRIDQELVEAQAKYEKRVSAGKKGGKAKAMSQQSSSNARAAPYQPITDNPKDKEDTSLRSVAPKKNKIRLPENWEVSEAGHAYAAAKGFLPSKVLLEAERFKNNAEGNGRLFAGERGIEAAWRNWVTSPYQTAGPQKSLKEIKGADHYEAFQELKHGNRIRESGEGNGTSIGILPPITSQ